MNIFLNPREKFIAEHHGYENLLNYRSQKIWLFRSVRPNDCPYKLSG